MKVYKYFDKYIDNDLLTYSYISTSKINELDEDITNIDNLFKYFEIGQIDYIQLRNSLKNNILPNWDTLKYYDKKRIALHNVIPSYEMQNEFYSLSEQIENYQIVVEKEVKAREKRWKKAMSVTAFYLLGNQMYQLMMYNDVKKFRQDWIDADLPHLICWLMSTSLPELGIDFTLNGFNSKIYYQDIIKEKALNELLK